MSTLSRRAAEVEQELGAAWTRYHVGAQASRFVAGVVVSLLLSLHNGFGDWTALIPLLMGAVWTTAAQMWPQVPWSLVRDRLHATQYRVAADTPTDKPVPSATDPAPPPAKG